MKLKLVTFFVVFTLLVSCSRNDDDTPIDCIGDSLLALVEHDAADDNPRKITFTVVHGDDPGVRSITWDFGDNATQTTETTTVEHTYAQAGTYHVKLTVRLTNSCSFEKTRSITVP